MERELNLLKFEFFNTAKETIPVPVKAYGVYFEESHDVLLVYEEEQEKAA